LEGGIEYRRWDVNRSKLAAYLKCGGRVWPYGDATSVLYLGGGNGTTVSHLSDICRQATITAIEISPLAFRDLLKVSEARPNVLPILGDAAKPEMDGNRTNPAAVLCHDIAQRHHAAMCGRNLASRPLYGRFARYYDLICHALVNYEGDVDYLQDVFRRYKAKPRTILDLGCGTGNHSVPLARRGYRVSGIDRSASMIAQAKKKAS